MAGTPRPHGGDDTEDETDTLHHGVQSDHPGKARPHGDDRRVKIAGAVLAGIGADRPADVVADSRSARLPFGS
jgi:hypothetical protein